MKKMHEISLSMSRTGRIRDGSHISGWRSEVHDRYIDFFKRRGEEPPAVSTNYIEGVVQPESARAVVDTLPGFRETQR